MSFKLSSCLQKRQNIQYSQSYYHRDLTCIGEGMINVVREKILVVTELLSLTSSGRAVWKLDSSIRSWVAEGESKSDPTTHAPTSDHLSRIGEWQTAFMTYIAGKMGYLVGNCQENPSSRFGRNPKLKELI